MKHHIRTESGLTILDLSGEIDVSYAPHLRDIMTDLLERNAGRLLVNLSDVVYMDSAGLSVLIAGHRQAQKLNGLLALTNLQRPVRQVFNITGVDKFIPLYLTIEEGIEALKK
ncbi:MAG: STAS domain-containing protein [Anaerolineae bacterium]|nr:STAS domain-containing protein [Anaerolineae bacterium]